MAAGVLAVVAMTVCARSAETREYALAATTGDASTDDSRGERLDIKRVASAFPKSRASLPLSVILLLGQSNIEPGHGFLDDLHNGTVDRVNAVSDRAEVCGRQCDQTYTWMPLTAADQWPGKGCEVRCHLLGDLVTPPQSGKESCRKVSMNKWSWYCQMEWGLGITFGPELSLALHVAEARPHRRVRVIRTADPGHPLSPDWGEGGMMLHLARANIHRFWEPDVPVESVGLVWVHGEVDAKDWEPSYFDNCPPEVCGVGQPQVEPPDLPDGKSLRVAPPPLQRLSHNASMAYASDLGGLVRHLRKEVVAASCKAGSCLDGNATRVVMVEPWAGSSQSCEPTDAASENQRLLMEGVKRNRKRWHNFTLLRVDDTLHKTRESTADSNTPMYMQRYCAWPKHQCRDVFRCAYGQGHFDTRGLMRLGKLLSKWYLKQGWCQDCD